MMAPENPLSHVIQHPLKEIPADLGMLTPKGMITVLSDQIIMMIVAGFLLTLLVPSPYWASTPIGSSATSGARSFSSSPSTCWAFCRSRP